MNAAGQLLVVSLVDVPVGDVEVKLDGGVVDARHAVGSPLLVD